MPVKGKKRTTMRKTTTTTKKPAKMTKQVSFEFYAPMSDTVAVAGTFNSWNPSEGKLRKTKEGYWKGSFSLDPGRYEYRFWVDGNWENDQQQVVTTCNPYGSENCVVDVTA